MKTSLIVAGLSLTVGIVMAQTPQRSTTPQTGSTANSESQEPASGKAETKAGSTAEIKTQTFKGALVDASCAGGGTSTTSSTSGKQTTETSKSSSNSSVSKTGEASRTGENNQSCVASANTSQFGLRMKDGRVMRFDAVGNERAKEAFSAKKKWSDASAAGKEIQATVSGAESGDQLTVITIH